MNRRFTLVVAVIGLAAVLVVYWTPLAARERSPQSSPALRVVEQKWKGMPAGSEVGLPNGMKGELDRDVAFLEITLELLNNSKVTTIIKEPPVVSTAAGQLIMTFTLNTEGSEIRTFPADGIKLEPGKNQSIKLRGGLVGLEKLRNAGELFLTDSTFNWRERVQAVPPYATLYASTMTASTRALPNMYSDILIAPFDEKTAKESQLRWANVLGSSVEVSNSIGMKFAVIPPGSFIMGTPDGEIGRLNDERQRKVTLTKPFLMGIHHVTVGQFRQFVQVTGYKSSAERDDGADTWTGKEFKKERNSNWKNVGFVQEDTHPVVCVDWYDATAFCEWLSAKESRIYRLPTEAEWEYCCRGGTQSAYPWGDNPNGGNGWANCGDLTAVDKFPDWKEDGVFNWHDGFVYTSPVGQFRVNPWGLYDMIGNAMQWCSNRTEDSIEIDKVGDQIDPTGPLNDNNRISRGGDWAGNPARCRSGMRGGLPSDLRSSVVGFRLVLVATPM